MNRVVITGIGVVSPVGCTLDGFWLALVEGRSGVAPLTIIPTDGLIVRIAAQVLGFNPAAHFDPNNPICWTALLSSPSLQRVPRWTMPTWKSMTRSRLRQRP